jgi:hypothetical protein
MGTGRVREAAGLLGVKGDSGYASCVPWLGCRRYDQPGSAAAGNASERLRVMCVPLDSQLGSA